LKLRAYQREAIDGLYRWFMEQQGDPLLVLPTAAGKSVIQAIFVKEAIERYPSTRVLMVSHVKELLEQNTQKLLSVWPMAPVGIYSAGLGRRDVGHQITVGGIQSIHTRSLEMGIFDLIMVDECHLIPPSGDGMYRRFLDAQRKINPAVKVIGMTATHYRMKTGLLHEGEHAIFDGIAYEVTVRRLIDEGYLSDLISKNGLVKADLSGVGTRGGEFIHGQLAKAMDKEGLTKAAIDECMTLCHDRKSWLLFCTGVEHAHNVAKEVRSRGVTCATITGDTPTEERAYLLAQFKAGHLRALTNCDVLTTGFDAPNIDAVIMLRPTKSTGLYVQIVGRGMRLFPGKKNCLVLDFSGNIERHGPIDRINPKNKKKSGEPGEGEAPVKTCPKCQTVVMISVMQCPDCGHVWEAKPVHEASATFADILSRRFKPDVRTLKVDKVIYRLHTKAGKPDSVKVDYLCGMQVMTEWVCFSHNGFARSKAAKWFQDRCPAGFATLPGSTKQFFDWIEGGMVLNLPTEITVNMGGEFKEITSQKFAQEIAA
jgi:DNA repair protein RadD